MSRAALPARAWRGYRGRVNRPALALAATCLAAVTACGSAPVAPVASGTIPAGAAAPGSASVTAEAPAAAIVPASTSTAVIAPTAVRAGRYAIGDSVMLGAKPNLTARGFRVNATVSRQFGTAKSLVAYAARTGTLPRNVIVHLGTNGTITYSDCRTVVRNAGSSRRVFFVTVKVPRSWMASNNRTLRRCDASFRAGRVVLIDWAKASAGRSSWFARDGYHLTTSGRRAYAALLDRMVDRYHL